MKEILGPIAVAVLLLYALISAVEFGASDAYRYMQIMGGMHCHGGICEVK